MYVFNYSSHLVYEIYTNHGNVYVSHDKSTGKVELVNGISGCMQAYENTTLHTNKDKEVFLPPLK